MLPPAGIIRKRKNIHDHLKFLPFYLLFGPRDVNKLYIFVYLGVFTRASAVSKLWIGKKNPIFVILYLAPKIYYANKKELFPDLLTIATDFLYLCYLRVSDWFKF